MSVSLLDVLLFILLSSDRFPATLLHTHAPFSSPVALPSFDKELSNLKANMSRALAAKESMSLQASIVSHSQRMMRLERILEGDG